MIPIWNGTPPEAKGSEAADIPTLGLYPLEQDAAGPAVLVCPGGGYSGLAMDHEGEQIAQWLNKNGLAAFVLTYRVSPYRHPVPLNDAKRAMRWSPRHAAAWKSPACWVSWGSRGRTWVDRIDRLIGDASAQTVDPRVTPRFPSVLSVITFSRVATWLTK